MKICTCASQWQYSNNTLCSPTHNTSIFFMWVLHIDIIKISMCLCVGCYFFLYEKCSIDKVYWLIDWLIIVNHNSQTAWWWQVRKLWSSSLVLKLKQVYKVVSLAKSWSSGFRAEWIKKIDSSMVQYRLWGTFYPSTILDIYSSYFHLPDPDKKIIICHHHMTLSSI